MPADRNKRLLRNLSVDSLATLTLERVRRPRWAGQVIAPGWNDFVAQRRVREILGRWIEQHLRRMIGREIRFRSDAHLQRFLKGRGQWRPYVEDPGWLIECAFGGSDETPDVVATFRALGVDPLALALGHYSEYEKAMAAAMLRLANAPDNYWTSPFRVPPAGGPYSTFDVCQPLRAREMESRRLTFHGRRPLRDGETWIAVYRHAFRDPSLEQERIKKRAARGKKWLDPSSPARLERFYFPQLAKLLRELNGYHGSLDYPWQEIWVIHRHERNLRLPIKSVSQPHHFQGLEFFTLGDFLPTI